MSARREESDMRAVFCHLAGTEQGGRAVNPSKRPPGAGSVYVALPETGDRSGSVVGSIFL